MLAAAAQFDWLAHLVSRLTHYRRAEEQTLATLHSLNPTEDDESAKDPYPKGRDAKRLGERSE
jgi:hypothetical protein